jgi:inner membrane protein
MSPVTHFLTGWVFANCAKIDRRERALVTLASVAPDIDGLGIIPELLTRNSAHPLLWFSMYHHSLHNLAFGLVVAAVAFALANRKWKTGLLAFVSFHLHLFEDLLGSRGPDGDPWPIPYLKPFSSAMELTWQGQWQLNAWPNVAITVALLMATFWLAWWRGFSHWKWFPKRRTLLSSAPCVDASQDAAKRSKSPQAAR